MLPNPFLFNDGTPVQTKDDWTCRRAQISALIQGYEAGELPPKPPTVTGSFKSSGATGTLTVTAATAGATVSWTNTITYPSGSPPTNGWPLVIAYEGGSIPIPSGVSLWYSIVESKLTNRMCILYFLCIQVATLNFPNSNIAQQNDVSSRGTGIFYNLYGSSATASAMTAWVWGVSRIIDVLENTPSAQIDTTKLAVTGCSRDGKGALMAGAFEERIALTIPQESGEGGDACWRLSKYESDQGSVVQTATEIVTENVWFSTNFNNYVNNLNVLPYDHHLLAALVAPRPLISFENTDYVWLSPMSSLGCMTATHTVYQALGIPDLHGFEQIGGHAHCAWPANLTGSLDAFFDRFLLGQNTSTNFFATNDVFNGVSWAQSNWINWMTPSLS